MACLEMEDILHDGCEANDAGIGSKHYYARLSDILTFPEAPAVPSGFADSKTVSADFVMQTGKEFKEVYCTLEKGEIVTEAVGARDGKSWQNTAEFYVPGSSPQLLGFMEAIKNDDLVMLVKEVTGQVRIIGSLDLPANLETGNGTTGKAISDEKGFSFTVRSIGGIAPVYTGAYPVPVGP